VRIGLAVHSDQPPLLDRIRRQAAWVEALGLDLVWIDPSVGGLATAAALAACTTTLRLVACTEIDRHPLEIAESAAVADNCANGRLVAVLADHANAGALLEEAVEVVLSAIAPRPFEHSGGRWRIPAQLAQNVDTERLVRLTPAPVQLELPVWLAGPAAATTARRLGLTHVADEDDASADADAAWRRTEAELGPAASRLRRPALRRLEIGPDGLLDSDALVGRLRAEREAWGIDVVFFKLPGEADDALVRAVLEQLAADIVPRMQLDALPVGLEQHWAATGRPEAPRDSHGGATLTIEEVIERYFFHLNTDELVGFRELWHPDAEVKAVGARPMKGVDEIVAFFSRLFRAWPRHHDAPVRVIVAGTTATVEVQFTGTTADGREVTFDAVDVFDIEEGQIRRLTNWYDIAYVRRQLAPPEPEAAG
jgi:ketosteroid isomerase-like protein